MWKTWNQSVFDWRRDFETACVDILEKVDIVFGEWVKNLTAGGQINHDSFHRNPQYGLSVAGESVAHVGQTMCGT